MGTPTQAALQRQSEAKDQAGEQLAQAIESFLADHPEAAVLEEGRVLFDLRLAHYSLSAQHGRCVLQLWSDECNLVRTVVEVQQRTQCLRLITRRMGVTKPQALELVAKTDRRTSTARETSRKNYQRLLERVLARNFPEAKLEGFRTAMDLAQSFGPNCVRGSLLRGVSAQAVIGVSEAESTATVDGALTAGILWLDLCRKRSDKRRHFGGLKVIVPAGKERTTAERMAWLNQTMAGFQLYTLDEQSEVLQAIDFRDTGNVQSRLVHAFSPAAAIDRCQAGVARVLSLIPQEGRARVEVLASSASEVGLSLHGLEFARVCRGFGPNSFAGQDEISFGAGPNLTPLSDENEEHFRSLLEQLFRSRHPHGFHTDALFRLQPERWLEARIRTCLREISQGLREQHVYSQVPALGPGERGMLDLLTLDREGRLTILELKADEDLHLPLQALDYWIRVRALNADRPSAQAGEGGRALSAFERAGYFPGAEVSARTPKLLLIAPALRIHPANKTVLHYLSPQVEWELIALNEHWRRELKVVFRNRAEQDKD